MEQTYNFNQVGKKMPFSMPEGFFDQMQATVLAEVEKEERAKRQHKVMFRRIFVAVASMAACICLAFVIGGTMDKASVPGTPSQSHAAASVASVDKAYDNLSSEEQQDLNATYANDVYLCME